MYLRIILRLALEKSLLFPPILPKAACAKEFPKAAISHMNRFHVPPSWTIYSDFVMKFAAAFRNLIIWLATSGFLNVLNHENLSLGTLAVFGKLEKI
jgi:hypothetical protein